MCGSLMPASRVCPTPGCPAFQPCPTHKRGTTTQRGYDETHKRERRANEQLMDEQGYLDCARCGQRIEQGDEWDQGHDDQRRNHGPEHARRCNRRAAGLKSTGG